MDGNVTMVCKHFGGQIVEECLREVVLELPGSLAIDTAELWTEMKKWEAESFNTWLNNAMHKLVEFPKARTIMNNYDFTNDSEFKDFIPNILSRKTCEDVCYDLKELARLFR